MEWRKEESSPLCNISTITVGPPSKLFWPPGNKTRCDGWEAGLRVQLPHFIDEDIKSSGYTAANTTQLSYRHHTLTSMLLSAS